MRIKVGMILVMAVCLSGCGGIARIPKSHVPAEDVIRSYRLTAEGDKLLEEGKDYPALLKYLEASRLNPYHEVIFNKLAVAYSRVQMFPQAKRAAERSLGLNPDYPFAHNTYGIIALAGQDYKGAIRSFQRAIKLRPAMANFYVNLGHAFLQNERFSRAKESYLKALELDPSVFEKQDVIELSYTTPPLLQSEKHYQMARLFAEIGDKESCLRYLAKAFQAGFSDRRRLWNESSFRPLHNDPDFIRLVGMYGMAGESP